mgnify:CR=1 FL=1
MTLYKRVERCTVVRPWIVELSYLDSMLLKVIYSNNDEMMLITDNAIIKIKDELLLGSNSEDRSTLSLLAFEFIMLERKNVILRKERKCFGDFSKLLILFNDDPGFFSLQRVADEFCKLYPFIYTEKAKEIYNCIREELSSFKVDLIYIFEDEKIKYDRRIKDGELVEVQIQYNGKFIK